MNKTKRLDVKFEIKKVQFYTTSLRQIRETE